MLYNIDLLNSHCNYQYDNNERVRRFSSFDENFSRVFDTRIIYREQVFESKKF